jgi:uncharacterized DUF497 family protein
MAVEWDPAKARANLRKHGVRFADAVTALEDASAISVRDERADEERWITIGIGFAGAHSCGGLHLAGRTDSIDIGSAGDSQGEPAIRGWL